MADKKSTTASSATKPPTPTQIALAATERAAKAEAELGFCNEQVKSLTATVDELVAARNAPQPAVPPVQPAPAKRSLLEKLLGRNRSEQPESVVLIVPPAQRPAAPQQQPLAAVAEARSRNGALFIIIALLLLLLAYTGGSYLGPWWNSHFGSLSTTDTLTIVKKEACPDGTIGVFPDCAALNTPAPNVDARVPIVEETCNWSCQKRLIEVHCGKNRSLKFEGVFTIEEFERILENDKVCKTPPPPKKAVKAKKAEKKVRQSPIVEEEPFQIVCPDKTRCGHKPHPIVRGCSIKVKIDSGGEALPQLTAWANGGKIGSNPINAEMTPQDGFNYIGVDCNFAYGYQGQVCLGDKPNFAWDLHPIWFKHVRKNLVHPTKFDPQGRIILNTGSEEFIGFR
ncbi:MAG: hypothetical protein G01um101456_254 [Parcubacteria group bacterium Gr01-1014_56]|nr:MAG: hypothetical protein G01um101456_254 [Parcubacteria group bacterium Gr01-1014_56]